MYLPFAGAPLTISRLWGTDPRVSRSERRIHDKTILLCVGVILLRHSLNQLGSYIVGITEEPKPRVGIWGYFHVCVGGWGRRSGKEDKRLSVVK